MELKLMKLLNWCFSVQKNKDDTDKKYCLDYVSIMNDFLYSPVKKDEWRAIINGIEYIIWFDYSFFVRRK